MGGVNDGQTSRQAEGNAHDDFKPLKRISACLFYIGCMLLVVVKYLWIVLAMIPLHSAVNLTVVRSARTSIIRTELLMTVAGVVEFSKKRASFLTLTTAWE